MAKNQGQQKSRVFVLQRHSRYDISAVKSYSKEIVYVIDDEKVSPFDTLGFTELVKHKIIMNDFDPQKDFICLTGPSILLALFLAACVHKFHYGGIKVLIFDSRQNKYKLRILELGV